MSYANPQFGVENLANNKQNWVGRRKFGAEIQCQQIISEI